MSIFWIIISYLLGSVPCGYLISAGLGKNVLQVGWKKTSGSNVFKNVGKLAGVATGLLDVAKGFLAVYLAQKLGLSVETQVLSGLAAIIGHNWSLFLGFAGGRGIGTLGGVLLAFSPTVFLLTVAFLVAIALIWDAAIGTLLSLILIILFSFYSGQMIPVGLLTILSVFPILIKRLSPIKEIILADNKRSLFLARIFFDDNQANWDFRIKRIIKKEKDNPSRAIKMVKPLAYSLMATSKFSWQAAKFGVRLAKKPIEKWVLRNQERVVLELTPADFKKMMIAAAKKIVLHQEEINRINVFPVADKDTGYNLAATLLGVEGVVSAKNYLTFRELSQDIKEAAMINARGNAGMIYTGYIVEFLDRIKHLKTIDAFHLALAMKRGIRAARNSVSEPVEGTILDVVRTVGLKSFTYAKTKKEKNILKILIEAHKESLQSLRETKEKLPVLKENDVVDAGALGFVKILEAWIDSLRGVEPVNSIEPGSMVQPQAGEKLEYKYEVVATFKNDRDLDLQKVKNELSPLGNSLDVVLVDDKIKFHIHTNQPENVQKKFKDFPDFSSRVEDMEGLIEKKKKLPLGLVIGETADLPADFLTKHNIIKVPFIARFPDGQTFSSSDEIIPEIRKALDQGRPLPISSAPSFKDFLTVYNSALERFEKILVLTLSSKLSGAYSSARIARSFFKKPDKLNIYVFDCNNAEAGEGLIAQHAQELIDQGKDLEEVIEELKTFCPKVNLLLCLDDFRCIARGGRLRIPEFLASSISFLQKAGLRFLISLKNGQLRFYQIGLGRDPVKILLREIKKKSQGKRIRLAITQTDNLPLAERLRKELRKDSQVEIALTSLASPAVVVHAGPGALLVAFYLIDK